MLRFCALLLLLWMMRHSAADPFNISEFPSHDQKATCKPFRFVLTTFTLPCKNSDFKVLLTPAHFTTVLAGDEQMTSSNKIASYSASAWCLNNGTFMREVGYVLKMKESVHMHEVQVMRNVTDGFSLTTYGAFSTADGTFVLEHKLCGKETKEGFELTFMQEFTFTHDPTFIAVERYLTNLVYQLAGLMDEQCSSPRINTTALSISMSANSSPIFDELQARGPLNTVQAIESNGSMVSARSVAKQYAYVSNWMASHNETETPFTFANRYYLDYYTLVLIGIPLLLLIWSICCCALSCSCRKKTADDVNEETDGHPEISRPMPLSHAAIAYV